jgi:hypothetical protein
MLTGMVASVGTPHLVQGSTEVVWNELSSDVNFRVESDGNANMLFVDAGTNRVGVGKASPGTTLDVDGTIRATTGIQHLAVARTATAAGDGTGLIADGTSFVTVTTADAAHIITLPTPTPGTIVWLGTQAESQAFEVRTDTPASVKINGGSGSNAESAIAAAAIAVRFVCINATNWLGTYWDADGDEAKVEAAA